MQHTTVLLDFVQILFSFHFLEFQGLMTPIIRNADQKSISSISAEVKRDIGCTVYFFNILDDKARHYLLLNGDIEILFNV